MTRIRAVRLRVYLMLALTVMLASCGGGAPSLYVLEKPKNVDMIVKMNHGDFWKTVKMGAEVAAKEYNVNLTFKAPQNESDIDEQVRLMEESIQSNADAIILSASDYMGLAQVTDRAAYYKIPVISMDSEVASARIKLFVGTNNYEAGQKAAKRLIDLIGPESRIGVMNFVKGAKNADEREEGFMDYVARYPGVEVVDIEYCESDEQLARQLTRNMMTKHPDINGIVALNEVASIGTAEEIQASGYGGKVKIITFDSTAKVMEMLQEGIVQATVVQNPFNNGYLAVQYAVQVMEGIELDDERIDTESRLIDLGNMLQSDNQKLLFPFVK
ncbi:substrate-binding domain-containing protein [Paenibacillus sp. HJL G12]|uniref:Substrate-binding domain-containing protein n=1 Tax=Paenibacillus dendrobii TaxID=2691084 RepID=A0A7X3IDS1_9BACL|nr:substrate-binding domain-containing protein [Paenibacillus dendrobii]MWV42054.1 substrate-binding domain-containing protein [Paenibacillus dendrobii]